MSDNVTIDTVKVNKSKFLAYAAAKHQMDVADLSKVYDVIVSSISDLTSQGHELSLTGFGVFSVKVHKGHPVQFGSSQSNVKDYPVLKFSASDALNRKIRETYKL